MARDLGKAKRADLTGKFPGEQAEYGSALARFLESAGQLRPLADGTYMDASGNGNGNGHGSETEVPRTRSDTGRSKDTEVAPMPGGNGRNQKTEGFAADTVFETQLDDAFGQEEMFPEQTLSLEPAFDGGELSPEPMLSPEPLAARVEPQSLDSVPDLLSPELDEPGEEPDDDTELLEGHGRQAQDLPPPQNSEDTGMLIAEAFSTRKEDGWNVDAASEDDDEPKITDKINRRPEGDEDLTKVFTDKAVHDQEKITNKVEPKRDVDPRAADPNAVVRDTVNFYNQTQNFQAQRKGSAGFPTISPNVVNSGQPLGLRDDVTERAPRKPEREDDTDLLRPDALAPSLDSLGPTLDAEPMLDAVEEAALSPDMGATFGPDEEPALSDLAELAAESDLDEADKRETDKFSAEDREPPQLPLPEGTDKVDKTGALPKRKARPGHPSGHVEGLEPLADEKVAAGKDTQRFYVAEILAKKLEQEQAVGPKSADSTDELQAAEEGPPRISGKSTSETSSDYTTDSAPPVRRRPVERPAAKPLPQPREVDTDFVEHVHVSASERIVPEFDEDEADGDDTVDEEATAEGRITDRFPVAQQPVRPPARPTPGRAAAHASGRERRVSDGLSKRLQLERAETLRLIEQAEAVAVRLREASSASQGDLAAISARRETARASRAELSARASAAETVFDEPLSPVVQAQAQPEPAVEPVVERETAEVPARPDRNRVPTRAIGEIVSELQRSAARPPASLSELLDQVSSRSAPTGGNGNHDEPHDADIDLLVAASSRLRETIESAREDYGEDNGTAEPAEEPAHRPVSSRMPESALSGDLDRLWQVLDSRRSAAITATRAEPTIEPATLLIPASDKARITPPGQELTEDGWTQEMLWPTLAGIAVVTFMLGAVFVWVLVRALG